MLTWTVIFLVIALIAGALGFTGVAAGATNMAKILFFIFLVLFLLSIIIPRFRTPIAALDFNSQWQNSLVKSGKMDTVKDIT